MARTSAISGTQRSRHDDSAVAVPVASAMVTLSSSSSHHRRLSLTNLDNTEKESALQDQQEDTHPLPRPPPPSKSFYNAENTIPYSYTPFDTFKSEPPSRVGTFFSRSRPKRTATSWTLPSIWIDRFFARHPSLERHRRLVGALVFTICTLLLLLIILLAILLSHKGSGNGNGGYGGGGSGSGSGSGSGGSGGGYGDGPTTSDSDLAKHNQGIPRPPINHSNATGWKSSGQGDGTFYDPSVETASGQFSMGACGYPYINSVHDFVVALNKPDFGDFKDASDSPACGQCIQVTGPNGTVQVQIVDMCPECKSGSLDLTPSAFSQLADLDLGRIHISWVRCPQ